MPQDCYNRKKKQSSLTYQARRIITSDTLPTRSNIPSSQYIILQQRRIEPPQNCSLSREPTRPTHKANCSPWATSCLLLISCSSAWRGVQRPSRAFGYLLQARCRCKRMSHWRTTYKDKSKKGGKWGESGGEGRADGERRCLAQYGRYYENSCLVLSKALCHVELILG